MQSSEATWLPLNDPRCKQPAVAGGKAAGLAVLVTAGMPVPKGFVLPVQLFERRKQRDTDGQRIRSAVRAGLQSMNWQPETRLVVRSSAVLEDSAFDSFAGAFETLLGIEPEPEHVLDAVDRCLASASSDRVATLLERTLETGGRAFASPARSCVPDTGPRSLPVPLAIIVQRQVPATISGILFTADPVSGARGEMVIEAAPGLPAALASGFGEPQRIRLVRESREVIERTAGVSVLLCPREVEQLCATGVRVENLRGAPQDVEWAFQGSGLYLLQARPMTTVFEPPRYSARYATVPVYTNANFVETMPGPVSPMGLSLIREIGRGILGFLPRPLLRRFDELGYELIIPIAGRPYWDLTMFFNGQYLSRHTAARFGWIDARAGRLLQQLAEQDVCRHHTAVFSAGVLAKTILYAPWRLFRDLLQYLMGAMTPERTVARWQRKALAPLVRFGREVDALRDPAGDAGEGPSSAFAVWRGAIAAFRASLRVVERISPAMHLFTLSPINAACRLRGCSGGTLSVSEALRLTAHYRRTCTALMNDALRDLAISFREKGLSAADLANGVLPDAALQTELQCFLDRYGHRGPFEQDVREPRFRDCPELVLRLILQQQREPRVLLEPSFLTRAHGARVFTSDQRERTTSWHTPSWGAAPDALEPSFLTRAHGARTFACDQEERTTSWHSPSGGVAPATLGGVSAARPPGGQGPSDPSCDPTEASDDAYLSELLGRVKNPLERRAIASNVRLARHVGHLREAFKDIAMQYYAALRQAALAVGVELVGMGVIDKPDDIFFLTTWELDALADAPDPTSSDPFVRRCPVEVRQRIAERHAEEKQFARCRPPLVIRGDGRTVRDAGEIRANDSSQFQVGEILVGTPASVGRVRGRARILSDLEAASRLVCGDILIARSTDPGWTPLFPAISGMVTEVGGALSHAATVAREWGLPAVVGLRQATQRIPDGALIELDGEAGTVERLREAHDDAPEFPDERFSHHQVRARDS